VRKAFLMSIAALFLATGAAQATENYFLQCGPRLVNVYGHHGYIYTEIVRGQGRGEGGREFPERMLRYRNSTPYFHGHKCYRISAMEFGHD
jgi:hypothetical protein